MPDRNDALAALPADARERLDAFRAALGCVNVGDLSLYAIPVDDAEVDRARGVAHQVARDAGLEPALEAARHDVLDYVAEDYRGSAAGLGYVGAAGATLGFGADDDRLRVMQSLSDAVLAVVLGDALGEDDRGLLLGAWDELPGAGAGARA